MSTLTISPRTAAGSLAGQAIVAGLIGGVVIDGFLTIAMHTTPISIWQFVASTIVGKIAFTSAGYAALGAIVHFVTSIAWAVAYLVVFGTLGQLKNWIVGAIVWGVVVAAAMELLLLVTIGQPFGPAFVQGLLPHIVFYALPVAVYMANAQRVESRGQ